VPRLFGNLLLSKYRITMALRHLLPWPPDPAHPTGMPRGALEAVLDTPSGKLRVVNTHLEYFSDVQRLAQVRHLRYLHWEACERARIYKADPQLEAPFQTGERPASAIICGDFNMAESADEYAELLAPNEGALPLVDAWRATHPDQARAPTTGLHGFKWPDKADCFDFFFVTEDLAQRITNSDVQSETAASDHQPIILDLA